MIQREMHAYRHERRFKRAFVTEPVKGQIFGTSSREYSVDKLFELAEELPIHKAPTAEFIKQLEDEVWTEDGKKVSPAKITPDSKHWKRMLKADLRYPILVAPDNEIMDGYHRLLKSVLTGKKFVLIQQFTDWPLDAQIKKPSD